MNSIFTFCTYLIIISPLEILVNYIRIFQFYIARIVELSSKKNYEAENREEENDGKEPAKKKARQARLKAKHDFVEFLR